MGELEIRKLGPEWVEPLSTFFDQLISSGSVRDFHPHAFNYDTAVEKCHYRGKDVYYICNEGSSVLAYCMLRGWDEGYDIPNLGIAIAPSARGIGLGKMLMLFLHTAALRRGAKKIRLKVHQRNTVAIELYKKLGYEFLNAEGDQLIGFLSL